MPDTILVTADTAVKRTLHPAFMVLTFEMVIYE